MNGWMDHSVLNFASQATVNSCLFCIVFFLIIWLIIRCADSVRPPATPTKIKTWPLAS
uniref:Uncharacterized protein n=1 Tax=Anguilla anguilla TaxID=7936 RepID=A0A0E9UJ88_ANGAN